MVLLLLCLLIAAPLILGPLLIYQRFQCVLPRVVPMDEDANYAPELFRHYVWNQERELSPLAYSLLGCTAETTGSGHLRYTAAFERAGHMNVVLVSMAFCADRYSAPGKPVYAERAVVSRVEDGTWVVTSDVQLVRPTSGRVERMSVGNVPAAELLERHGAQVGARARRANAGMARTDHYVALLQESIATQEIYDALARRDLMQDEETGAIRPTWTGAMLIAWRHFGLTAWVLNMTRRLDVSSLHDQPLLEREPTLAHIEK